MASQKGRTNKRSTNPENNRTQTRPLIKWLLRFFMLGLFGVFLVVVLFLAVLFGAFGELPTADDLSKKKIPLASEVYASDGSLLGKYYIENRSFVQYDNISPYVIKALVSTEDKRFFSHKGFDAISYIRVMVKSILLRSKTSGGGSTIGQQTIKNLYKRKNYSFLTIPVNKIKEAIVAVRLEKIYDKEDIITLYLNTVPFGERAFGIGTAANRFFSKKAADLSVEEAATLVGLLKATTYYSPRLNPQRSQERRNTVLKLMQQNGDISKSEMVAAQKKDLILKYNRKTSQEELAPHFRAMLKEELKKWTDENPITSGKKHNIFTDGLKIYTTIESTLQKHAQNAVYDHMPELHKSLLADWPDAKAFTTEHWDAIESAWKRSDRYKVLKKAGKSFKETETVLNDSEFEMKIFTWDGYIDKMMTPKDSIIHYLQLLNTGFVAMDPETGAIQAWVGGIDIEVFQEDHVTVPRQVGSTFKPFTYATALARGIDPCTYYPNELRQYSDWQDWTPHNAGNEPYEGYYSLKGALAHSVNTIAAQVIFEAGIDNVIYQAKKMGITSKLPKVPSITLGTADISPLEMASAYCTFANGGYVTPPFFLKEIKTQQGKTIASWKPEPKLYREKVLDDSTVKMMQVMMRKVVDEGTGKRMRWQFGLKNEIAGKTGTTQDQGDGWFIAYTPGIVAAAWVGSEDRRVHFRTLANGQGSRVALPVVGGFFKKAMNNQTFAKMLGASFNTSEYFEMEMMGCELYVAEIPLPDPIPEPPSGIFDFDGFFSKLKKNKGEKKNSTANNKNSKTFNGDLYKDKPKPTRTPERPKAVKTEKETLGSLVEGWFKKRKDKKKKKRNERKGR